MTKIKSLSQKISDQLVLHMTEEPTLDSQIRPYFEEIKAIGLLEFMTYNYSHYGRTYSIMLNLYTYELWSQNTMDYWKNLMINTKGWEGSSTLIEFLHKYIEINSLQYYLDLPEVTLTEKKEVVKFFSKMAIFLWHSEEDVEQVTELQEKEGIQFDFQTIKKRLIEQGASPAPATKDELRQLIANVKLAYPISK